MKLMIGGGVTVVPVGAVIRTRRRKLKMNQATLASLMGLSQSTVSKMETGMLSPTIDQLMQFANVLHMQPQDFFVRDPYRASTEWFGIETLRQLRQLHSQGEVQDMLSIIKNAAPAPFFKTTRNHAELMYWKAVALTMGGRYHPAVDLCQSFLNSNPDYPDTSLTIKYQIVLGTAYRHLEQVDDSKSHLETALQLLQRHPEIIDSDIQRDLLYNLGCTYEVCGLTGDAMDVCSRLKLIHDECKQNWLAQTGNTLAMMGDIAIKRGSLETALEYYALAVRDYAAISHVSGEAKIVDKIKLLCLNIGEQSMSRAFSDPLGGLLTSAAPD